MCMSLIVLQQPRVLSFYLLIKTAREAISSTHLDVLLGHNLYSANLKPLFLFQNLEFHPTIDYQVLPSISINFYSFHKTIISVS